VGYRQVWSYLEGEIDLTTCREKVLAATRQLAKRQLTWLRRWPDLTWIWTDEAGQLIGGGNPAVGATDSNDYGLSAPAEGIWFGRLQELMRNF
jgi:tRNA dimethylallyltransferase